MRLSVLPVITNAGAKAALSLVLVIALAGCSTRKPDAVPLQTVPRLVLPIPEDLRLAIDKARALGVAIYLQDKASAIASDVLRANVPALEENAIGGWITRRSADAEGRMTDWWSVDFFSAEAQPRIRYHIAVPTKAGLTATFAAPQPPATPDQDTAALIRARQAALSAIPPTDQPINSVLIPGGSFGEQGILVYLLAASPDPTQIVLGKHFRVTVDPDSSKVRAIEPLSRSALSVSSKRSDDEGGRIVAPVVQHNLTDSPLETHVFASLQYGLPLMVATPRGVWWIDGDRVQLIATELPPRATDLLERK